MSLLETKSMNTPTFGSVMFGLEMFGPITVRETEISPVVFVTAAASR